MKDRLQELEDAWQIFMKRRTNGGKTEDFPCAEELLKLRAEAWRWGISQPVLLVTEARLINTAPLE